MLTDLLEAAARLGPMADLRATELDNSCRIPDDLQGAALSAGLFRTLVPAEFSGLGATPLEWFRCGLELARHETSFGWVVTQGAVELGYIAVGGQLDWARTLLSDHETTVASSVAGMGTLRPSQHGLLFSGSWAFNTGAPTATWVGGLATIEGTEPADVRLAYVPAERATVLDDWDPSGLRGSGSNSTVIPEQPIDPAWVLRPFATVGNERGPHRCLLGNGNWPIATSVASTLLGAARRAIEETAAFLLNARTRLKLDTASNDAVWVRELLIAEATWNACRASVERELESMWLEATELDRLSTQQRVRLFAANALASDQATQIIDTMCKVTGTLTIKRDHPLTRLRRDAHALRAHRAVNGEAVELAGRMSLGIIAAHRRI